MSSAAAARAPKPTASPPLRGWQLGALAAMERWQQGSFLISAAPGAGKTRPSLEFISRELSRRACQTVVIAAPTAPLTRQWARAAHELGLNLAPDAESPHPPAGFHGVVVTYARIAQAPARWAAAVRASTLVVADEAHHLGEDLSWGEAFRTAFAQAQRWLLLSGTPFRSDGGAIPGVSYDSAGLSEPDVSYTYADAVRDGVCRPVHFVAYDGSLSWRSGEDVIEAGFDTVLSSREASRRYRTAISTELPDGLPRILREADARLRAIRAGQLTYDGRIVASGAGGMAPHPDAGGLVIAADSDHARKIAKLLHEAIGFSPVVVLHQDARSAQRLAAFTRSTDPWIVAVNMVSEGVDIPRLRVGVYATAAKTPLIFRQIVGRFVRTVGGRENSGTEPSWLYLPADPVLRDHAATVEQDLRSGRRERDGEAEEGLLDEPPERTAAEPSAQLDFEALSADVAAQMTLFGPAPVPAAPPPPVAYGGPSALPAYAPAAGAGGPPEPRAREVPLYERRAKLRKERHRLVGDLARREGFTHQEVNGQINRELGIASVDKATIEQLQRSIELLERRLSRR